LTAATGSSRLDQLKKNFTFKAVGHKVIYLDQVGLRVKSNFVLSALLLWSGMWSNAHAQSADLQPDDSNQPDTVMIDSGTEGSAYQCQSITRLLSICGSTRVVCIQHRQWHRWSAHVST
jgi:hypothetical protein